jgi:hypothetical protein
MMIVALMSPARGSSCRCADMAVGGLADQFVTAKAAKVTVVANFDTYLVVDGTSTYHVTWSATTVYDPSKKTTAAIVYATGAAGDVKALPKDFKTILDASYAGNKIK